MQHQPLDTLQGGKLTYRTEELEDVFVLLCISDTSFLCLSERRPGACLVVSGPGLIHALGGMANANVNCWYKFTNKLSHHLNTIVQSFSPEICSYCLQTECFVQACDRYWRVLRSKSGNSRGFSGVPSGNACAPL